MKISKTDIVCALAGKEEGKLFVVIDTEDGFAFIADGKSRKVESPKRKNVKHLRKVTKDRCDAVLEMLQSKEITNKNLRRALAVFTALPDGEHGGM